MSISSALNASVSGLNANSSRLATISDNIANASTHGYKRSVTTFESMVLSSAAGAGQYTAGGVRSQATRLIDERGPLIGTSNALDIAVTGRGMLPVTRSAAGVGEGGLLMTTTGAFRTDENGVLKTPSGLVLLGWPANGDGTIPTLARDSASGLVPVVIDANQRAGDPTTRMKLGVNLPATATAPGASGDAIPLSVEYFGNLGTSETLEFTFTPTVGATAASNQWRLEIRDAAQGNAVVGEYVLSFDGSRADGGTLSSVTQVSGGAYDAAEGTVSLNLAGGPLTLTLGKLADRSGLTQLADAFSPLSVTKNGTPVGKLSEVTIDEGGLVRATYDTGFTRTLYQIPLADVPNINGLTALDDQTFRISNDSGAFFLWDAGDGPTGTVEGFAREGSTTDMAEELTNLIQTQRAYSSNAKVIQTVDEMLQETTNIKR
ncbi:flagellar hook protein FlgE [Gemmobacter serpentinus]|uniref:flagellar hook protein FlgE n=1 Tax=Gemmobacter serpentinus TaxID=2652247 RepID=UPI00124DA86B|nr:flagellar hook-basal body complex protein [Gemmobacter serpentinus]